MLRDAEPGLLSPSLASVDWNEVYRLDTKRYTPNYLSNQIANDMPWEEFRNACGAIYSTLIEGSNLEALVVPKSVTWSDKDTNIYIGSTQREVRSFLDFSRDDFSDVFGWNVSIAVDLSAKTGEDIYCTHGFNPEDTSPDAHSVRTKFHTHIHIPDKVSRSKIDPGSLNTFEQLMLVEPFSEVYWDFAYSYLKNGYFSEWAPTRGNGYFSLQTRLSVSNKDSLVKVYDLLSALKDKYKEAVDVFTDRRTEDVTGYQRYIPRDHEARMELLDQFIEANRGWLSAHSIALLHYLGENIRAATPRDPEQPVGITNGGQLWLAKGFSGAINFVVSTKRDALRFDLAPRIISTSGATKILSDAPTIITKSRGEADDTEIAQLRKFESDVIASMKNL